MNSTGRHDGGFTLIEASIALLIASFIFLGLAQTISSALRASEQRRLEQQAVALISEVVASLDEQVTAGCVDVGDPVNEFFVGPKLEVAHQPVAFLLIRNP